MVFGALAVPHGRQFQTEGPTKSLRVVILVVLPCVSRVGASHPAPSSTRQIQFRPTQKQSKATGKVRQFPGLQGLSRGAMCRRQWQGQSSTSLRCPRGSGGSGVVTSQVAWTVARVGGSPRTVVQQQLRRALETSVPGLASCRLLCPPFGSRSCGASCKRPVHMPCSPFWTLARCCFSRWIPSARLGCLAMSPSVSCGSGIRLAKRAGIAHRSWCLSCTFVSSESRVAPAEVSWAAIVTSTAAANLSHHQLRDSLAHGLRLWTAVCCWLRYPLTQEVLHSCPSYIVLRVQPLRGLTSRHCRLAHRAEAQAARFAFPATSAMAPFRVASLAPDSVRFADGPVLKIRVPHCCHPTLPSRRPDQVE